MQEHVECLVISIFVFKVSSHLTNGVSFFPLKKVSLTLYKNLSFQVPSRTTMTPDL